MATRDFSHYIIVLSFFIVIPCGGLFNCTKENLLLSHRCNYTPAVKLPGKSPWPLPLLSPFPLLFSSHSLPPAVSLTVPLCSGISSTASCDRSHAASPCLAKDGFLQSLPCACLHISEWQRHLQRCREPCLFTGQWRV